MIVTRVTKLACDFCSKNQDQVSALIVGPKNVAICNECYDLCTPIVDKAVAPNPQESDERTKFEAAWPAIHKTMEWTLNGKEQAWAAWKAATQLDHNMRNEVIEECARFIENGHFLHDQAPPKLFADECTREMRASLKSYPPQKPEVQDGDAT